MHSKTHSLNVQGIASACIFSQSHKPH